MESESTGTTSTLGRPNNKFTIIAELYLRNRNDNPVVEVLFLRVICKKILDIKRINGTKVLEGNEIIKNKKVSELKRIMVGNQFEGNKRNKFEAIQIHEEIKANFHGFLDKLKYKCICNQIEESCLAKFAILDYFEDIAEMSIYDPIL